jgi:gamma-glutamyl-gamma-aminobutyraldehyde dehydrogenase
MRTVPERTERAHWAEIADRLVPRADAFIDGRFVPSVGGARRASIDPATGATLAQVADCADADVDLAVAAAKRAFDDGRWSRRSARDRQEVLLRLSQLILDDADRIAVLETLDGGKPIADTSASDVPGSAAILRWYAEVIDKLAGEIPSTGEGDLALVTREPLGVIGAVVPWNYPLETAIWKIAPALATGNTVVLKPAEVSPLTALRLAELAREAGLPDGVLNVVPGPGPVVGQALGRHRDVAAITFTGSTAVGGLFLRYAGESAIKPVWLECGGKSANVVFGDVADLDRAADGVIDGIFSNQGQVCSANSRLLVDRSIKDALLERVLQRVAALAPGDPLDPAVRMGPLVSVEHADLVRRYIEAGRREATLLVGGTHVAGAATAAFVPPTIFDDVSPDAMIAREEIFGPVLAVTTFDSEDEAIALANDSMYALAASVWSDSLARVHRVAPRLRAGTVSVNRVDAIDVAVPFGGFGQSGSGRDLSVHALEQYTGLKTTWIDYR